MKLQYLGDSKDSFKWDYLNALTEALDYRQLRIAWMLTPDDPGNDGRTAPERYPARPEILALCKRLRSNRNPDLVAELPDATQAPYSISFHSPAHRFTADIRGAYFATLRPEAHEILFMDPDNGFEPERSFSTKHLRYAELEQILQAAPADFVAVVFQHHRRRKFSDDFARICNRLLPMGHATAIYWQSLMFVAVSPSADTIAMVRAANGNYARERPTTVL